AIAKIGVCGPSVSRRASHWRRAKGIRRMRKPTGYGCSLSPAARFRSREEADVALAESIESFSASRSQLGPPNLALQRAAFGINCSAAGGRAKSAHERWRARVLKA